MIASQAVAKLQVDSGFIQWIENLGHYLLTELLALPSKAFLWMVGGILWMVDGLRMSTSGPHVISVQSP